MNSRNQGEPPFILLPHQLLQILRPFGQRTHDYDATFIELFSRPQIKSAQGILPNDLAQKILAKISGLNDLPPEIAVSIIMDQAFRRSVLVIKDAAEQDKLIDEKIESAIAIELKQYKERLEKLELDIKKQGRDAEAEIVGKDKKLGDKDRLIKLYRNLAFFACLILFIIINILVYLHFWANSHKVSRIIGVLVDITALYAIFRIKWRSDKTLNAIFGIATIVALLITIALIP